MRTRFVYVVPPRMAVSVTDMVSVAKPLGKTSTKVLVVEISPVLKP